MLNLCHVAISKADCFVFSTKIIICLPVGVFYYIALLIHEMPTIELAYLLMYVFIYFL